MKQKLVEMWYGFVGGALFVAFVCFGFYVLNPANATQAPTLSVRSTITMPVPKVRVKCPKCGYTWLVDMPRFVGNPPPVWNTPKKTTPRALKPSVVPKK